MTGSLLVRVLVERLESVGYEPLATPFRVASVEFEFTAALIGTAARGLDLVLIVDTSTGEYGDRNAIIVRQRIEALSRALDITNSRYVLTVVLAGASLPGDIEALSGTCRVLSVEHVALEGKDQPTDGWASGALDDHIRILLPLDLRTEDAAEALENDPVGELIAALPETLDEKLVRAIAAASLSGSDTVTQALGKRLEEVLVEEAG